MIVFVSVGIFLTLFLLLESAVRIPPLRVSMEIQRRGERGKPRKGFSGIMETLSAPLARYIRLSVVTQNKLTKLLRGARESSSPEQFAARLIVTFSTVALCALPLLLLSKVIALVPVAAGAAMVLTEYSRVAKKGAEYRQAIELELPSFISTFTSNLRSNGNIIDIIDTYKQNGDTELTRELSRTVSDMRTGSPELALQRLATRLNIPMLTEMVRYILATMAGEDMTINFERLIDKAKKKWALQLREKVQAVKPKVSAMTVGIAMYSMIALLTVMVVSAVQLAGQLM